MDLRYKRSEEHGDEWMQIEHGDARRDILPVKRGGKFPDLETCHPSKKKAMSPLHGRESEHLKTWRLELGASGLEITWRVLEKMFYK